MAEKIRVSGSDMASMLMAGGYKGFSKEQEDKIKSMRGSSGGSSASARTPLSRSPSTESEAQRFHSAYVKLQANKERATRRDTEDKRFKTDAKASGSNSRQQSGKVPLLTDNQISSMQKKSIDKLRARQNNFAFGSNNSNVTNAQLNALKEQDTKLANARKNAPKSRLRKEDGWKKDASAQKTDAQSKTAKSPRGKGVKEIAAKMKENGKTGWVTINGAHINLGGE